MEKYTVVLDKDLYVLSIGHSLDDSIELDLEDIYLDYINCYQLINGQLTLDSQKLEWVKKEEEEKKKEESNPTWQETIESQVLYTAMMTDTLIVGE